MNVDQESTTAAPGQGITRSPAIVTCIGPLTWYACSRVTPRAPLSLKLVTAFPGG